MSKITDISSDNNDTQADNMIVAEGCYPSPWTYGDTIDGCPEEGVDKLCLQKGSYEFTIRDIYGGISDPGYYVISSNGEEIKRGGGDSGFKDKEITVFAMPLLEKPSTQPSISYSPTNETSISAQPTTSLYPTEDCWFVDIDIEHEYPEDITWTMSKLIDDISNDNNATQVDNMIVAEGCYPNNAYNRDCLEEAVDKLCLQEGSYEFTIQNRNGVGIYALMPSSTPSVEFVCQIVSTKKECIKQSDSCMWDNEKDICIDAATSFPTFSPSTMPTSTSIYPRTSPPNTPWPTESGGAPITPFPT